MNSKLEAAQSRLIFDQKFFAVQLLSKPIIEDASIPTMATDGNAIYINPSVVDRWTTAEIMGVFAHEVCHIMDKTHLRRHNRDPRLWNIASDYAINDILHEAKIIIPKAGLYDPRFHGMSAEEIYPIAEAESKPKGEGRGQGEDRTGGKGAPAAANN